MGRDRGVSGGCGVTNKTAAQPSGNKDLLLGSNADTGSAPLTALFYGQYDCSQTEALRQQGENMYPMMSAYGVFGRALENVIRQ